jgi:hypothetical protein
LVIIHPPAEWKLVNPVDTTSIADKAALEAKRLFSRSSRVRQAGGNPKA